MRIDNRGASRFAISPDEVRTTAAMARLALSPDDITRYTAELSRILDYVAKLQEVDVAGVEPTTHALPLLCPLREDVVGPHLPAQIVLRSAPATENGLFSVPAIWPVQNLALVKVEGAEP